MHANWIVIFSFLFVKGRRWETSQCSLYADEHR